MASPYDSAIDMFNLPRFGAGNSPFPRREDPMTAARRRFLEGGAAPAQEDFVMQRAQESDDPFGVMQEVENLRREREEQSFLSDIAALNPAQPDYGQSMMGLIQKNPRIASSKAAMGLLDFQRNFMPKQQMDKFAVEAAGFGAPIYQTYQRSLSSGKDPVSAYADAMSEKARLESLVKPKDERLTLSGDAREEYDSIMADIAAAQSTDPTEAEKRPFLDPARKSFWGEWQPQDWDAATNKARQKKLADANARLQNFRNVYGEGYKLPPMGQGAPAATQAPLTAPAPQNAPQALQTPATTVSETVTPSSVTETVQDQAPVIPRDEESEKLWSEYIDLENSMRVDARSTNPADQEADRELRGEKKKIQSELMKRLKIPDTKEGNKLFQQMWQGRRNSMAEGSDSRGQFLTQPLQKTGATGNTWVIRPA